MKILISLTLFLFCFSVNAQDTLYFPSGEIQLVDLISINKEAGLIKYKFDGQIQIRSITSLKTYSNHANVDESNLTLNSGTFESGTEVRKRNRYSVKDPSKYSYSKFSVGANLLSSVSSAGSEYDFTIASNYNQSLYFQYNLNDKIGIRLPLRIGFNQLKDTTTIEQSGYPRKHNRELFAEGGIELVLMANDNQRINPYLMPGLYFGVNQGVIEKYNYTNYNLTSYYPASKHNYYRLGLTGGLQFNFSKYVQLNTELGFNYNNATIYYYEWANSNQEGYAYKKLGLQAAINLVYRFGGKLR